MRRRTRGPAPGNVLGALDELGIAYTVHGDEATARCPKHNDRHPSWSCNTITGEHNCFACGFGGPFTVLVARVLRLEDGDAARWVRKRGGVERARAALEEAPAAVRRVYAEPDLALFTRPPRRALAARRLTREACQAYGVLYDRLTDRWILPIRDPHTGKLWGWQEKGDGVFRNRPYGITKSEALFGYQLLTPGCRAFLVESPLDAVRMRVAGYPFTVASYGAAVSETQLALIVDRCSGLLCALDNDDAGWERAAWLKDHAPRGKFKLHYFDYTGLKGKDPGEMTDDDLHHGITRAYSALIARF